MGKFNHRFGTGRPRVAASIERKVRTHRTKGMGIKAIARKLGIGTGTVQRIVKDTNEQSRYLAFQLFLLI